MDALLNNSLPPPRPGNIFPKGPGQEEGVCVLPSDSGEAGLSFSLSVQSLRWRASEGSGSLLRSFCRSGAEAMCLLGSTDQRCKLAALFVLRNAMQFPVEGALWAGRHITLCGSLEECR